MLSNVVPLTLERMALLSTQFQGCSDGCQRLVDESNFDIIPLAVSSWSNLLLKVNEYEYDGLVEGGFLGKRWDNDAG